MAVTDYLCFTAEQANSTVTLKKNGSPSWSGSCSTDGITWTTYSAGTAKTLTNTGDKIYFKGTLSADQTSSNYMQFVMTGKIAASGNLMSLIYQTDFATRIKLDRAYAFYYMFCGCTSLTQTPELPATTLATDCYSYMFRDCTSLVTPPELPATTLATYCYYQMFYGCTSLTTPPELPATTLASSCYCYMFRGCTSLVTPPKLPATTLTSSCYSSMFYGCTSLTTPPELPATTLESSCYYYMFCGCTSLVTPPELPATTLTSSCYYNMFYGCTSLKSLPELPATTLATDCYSSMFYGCTGLENPKLPDLKATTLTSSCYYYMFYGCTSIKLSTARTKEYNTPFRVPTTGTGTAETYSLTNMFTNTGGTFAGTPSINKTYYYYYKKDPVPNKVTYGNTVLLDLTGDTVVPAHVRSGVTFHTADGYSATGTASTGATSTLSGTPGINKVIYNGKTLIDLTADTITPGDVVYGFTFHACDGNQYVGDYGNDSVIYSYNGDVRVTDSYGIRGDDSISQNSGNYYYWYSNATSSHVGESILNHLTSINIPYETSTTYRYLYGGPYAVEAQTPKATPTLQDIQKINPIMIKWNSCTLTARSVPPKDKNITVLDENGIILDVDTWTNVQSKLNSHSYNSFIMIIGNYVERESHVKYKPYGNYTFLTFE